MNKIEIQKGLYRQNVYNVNLGDGHYNHVTCYFKNKNDNEKNIVMIFKAGENLNMTSFIEDTSIKPLTLPAEIIASIQESLTSWTYNHIESVDLYNAESIWNKPGMSGIFEITERDNFVIQALKNHPAELEDSNDFNFEWE